MREPDLCGIPQDVFGHALRRQIQEKHEAEGSQIQIDERANDLLGQAVDVLQSTIMATPFITSHFQHFVGKDGAIFPSPQTGNVRALISPSEFHAVTASLCPTAPTEATPTEQTEVSYDEAA